MQNICELLIHHCSRKRAHIAIPVLASLLLAAISSPSQTSSVVKDATVYNRAVLQVGNDKLEVAIVKQGGSMLRILIQGDPQGISPFGNPELVPGVPDNRKLNGPMVGHFVCVDGFGSPSKEEAAAGIAMHGEAYLQPWKLVSAEKQAGVATVKFTVDLPKFQETFARSLQIVDGENVIYIDSELTSDTAFDRTANWGEHLSVSTLRGTREYRGRRLRRAFQDAYLSREYASGHALATIAGFHLAWRAGRRRSRLRHAGNAGSLERNRAHDYPDGSGPPPGVGDGLEQGAPLPTRIRRSPRRVSVGAELYAILGRRLDRARGGIRHAPVRFAAP